VARRGEVGPGVAWHFRAGKEDYVNQRLRDFVKKYAVCLVWVAFVVVAVLFIALMRTT
jgi:hypothetical protein